MKNAFSTFVFGSYERFIPYYVSSIHKNYPEADIIIFYADKLSAKTRDFLDSKNGSVIVYENHFKNQMDKVRGYSIKGGSSKLFRFLITGDFFKSYENVFFGDVDILILKEKNNLFSFHLSQAKNNNVPFSNKVRKLPKSKELSKRLTGLHFVKTESYFYKIDPIIENFFNSKEFRDALLQDVRRDEEFLYKLNQLAFDFNPLILSENKRPWHGFHLGLVRGKDYLNLKTVEENSSIPLNDLKQQLADFNKGGTINRMLIDYTCKEVYYTYKYLNLPLSNKVIIKYSFLNVKKLFINKLRKIKSKIFND